MSPLFQDGARGFVLGLSIAAPVGPIGLLCIRRSLARGPWVGIAGGLGTAVADAAYAAVAAFGLTAVSTALSAIALPLQCAGIVVLAMIGVRTFRSAPPRADEEAQLPHAGLFAQTFFLTLTNPATILSFAAMFAGLGLVAGGDAARAGMLVAGTFTGSLAWWILLGSAVGVLRHHLTPQRLLLVNRAAGVMILAFAAVLAWTTVHRML